MRTGFFDLGQAFGEDDKAAWDAGLLCFGEAFKTAGDQDSGRIGL